MPFNDSTAASIANASKSCGFDDFTDKYLTFPPSGQQPDVCAQPGINADCTNYIDGCDVFDAAFSAIFDINPGFNICKILHSLVMVSFVRQFLGSKPIYCG